MCVCFLGDIFFKIKYSKLQKIRQAVEFNCALSHMFTLLYLLKWYPDFRNAKCKSWLRNNDFLHACQMSDLIK